MIRPIMKIGCLIFFVCLAFQPLLHAQLPETIELDAGESRVLQSAFNIEKIAVGDPDILGCVKVRDQEMLLNAKGAGKTNIFVWGTKDKAEVRVIIRNRDLEATAAEIRAVIQSIEGVDVRITGNRIFVEGEVFSHNDLKKIKTVVQGLSSVVNLVELSPVMKDIVKKEIEKSLVSQGMRNVKVSVAQNNFMLTGHVASDKESSRAQRIAQAYSPDIVNAIAIRTPSASSRESFPQPEKPVLIEMAVNIMEIERNALKGFGVHWNPGGTVGGSGTYSSASGQSPTLAGSLAGTLSNLLPKMRKINEKGQGRSLMQQTLITKSGDAANLFAGSEVPIPVAQDGGNMSVQYKKIGVTLNFQPTVDSYGNVVSSIRVESSSITGEGPGGAPTISSTNLNTVLSVASGQSIALGGMMGQRDVEAISGSPPGGGSSLFQANKAKRKGSDTREVVIFVTPTILSAETAGSTELKKSVEDDFKANELEKLRKQAR